jgi:DNA-directed RNA polymerase specialized sigma24 family protein
MGDMIPPGWSYIPGACLEDIEAARVELSNRQRRIGSAASTLPVIVRRWITRLHDAGYSAEAIADIVGVTTAVVDGVLALSGRE